jgi:hypothetical protein
MLQSSTSTSVPNSFAVSTVNSTRQSNLLTGTEQSLTIYPKSIPGRQVYSAGDHKLLVVIPVAPIPATYPTLAVKASSYTYYKFQGMVVKLQSNMGTSENGQVYLGSFPNFDAVQAVQQGDSAAIIANTDKSIVGSIFATKEMSVPMANLNKQFNEFTIMTEQDFKPSDEKSVQGFVCILFTGLSDSVTAETALATLQVCYRVAVRTPRLPPSDSPGAGAWRATGLGAVSNPFYGSLVYSGGTEYFGFYPSTTAEAALLFTKLTARPILASLFVTGADPIIDLDDLANYGCKIVHSVITATYNFVTFIVPASLLGEIEVGCSGTYASTHFMSAPIGNQVAYRMLDYQDSWSAWVEPDDPLF